MTTELPQSGESLNAAKQALRKTAKSTRDRISQRDAARAASAAARHLLALPDLSRARIVAVYADFRGELGTAAARVALRERGFEVALPRVTEDLVLAFHQEDDGAELSPGNFGVPEPAPSWPQIPTESIDAFVVPGLAFDESGARLGWGKGHYDATLAETPNALRIGYGFECQMHARIPRDDFDVPMDFIVTESGVKNCRGAQR